MELPEELRYTSEHEWVAVDGSTARVGITDFAQDALGDVVYVDLPDVGSEVAAGDACAEVESTKSVSEIYAPVAGTVAEINLALEDTPELLNSEPYGQGWLVVITCDDPSAPHSLMDHEAYASLIEG